LIAQQQLTGNIGHSKLVNIQQLISHSKNHT